jgi:GTPase SAR1 family protein
VTSGSNDGSVRIWDATSGKQLQSLEGHTSIVHTVSWSPNGKYLASGSSDKCIRIWDATSGTQLRCLDGHALGVLSVSWSPDGKMVASGSHDKTVRLWDAVSGKELRRLEGHTNGVLSVSWSPDGKTVASGSSDKSVRLWDAASGTCLGVLPVSTSTHQLLDVAFRPADSCRPSLGQTVLGDPDIRADLFDSDVFAGLAPHAPLLQVISAKVVLVGESNVGKSYLAHHIVTGQPPGAGEIQSTHGMKFWSLAPEQLSAKAKTPGGQRRGVVLWDMGGQKEYRLVHQLFLHDTTVALLLLDPTRGTTAFNETEVWNKYLEKQLRGRAAVKLLVGAKLDQPSDVIDRPGIDRLRTACGFHDYVETSAITGRGIDELGQALEKAIDWDELSKTTRPELFQRIRDEIEAQRKRGEVVLRVEDLYRALGDATPTEETRKSVQVVTEQLAAQGVIACSRLANGEAVIVLQIHEIERYAGSLIVAARNNPRGVPALELRAIGVAEFVLPGIAKPERLPRLQELAVLDCTIRLLVEHGICFEHEGLLIFPTLFATVSVTEADSAPLTHAVSLYYDFAGAIDNIYASLIAWLVVVKDFGRLRLWPDRAEFEVKDGGLCGLRKVGRPGGFAHVDVYFEKDTPEERRAQFISFVEDHVAKHGVEIFEHVAIRCPCGEVLPEETLRKRIARGDKDISCPVCDSQHSLTEGATATRKRNPNVAQNTWALKGRAEKASRAAAKDAAQRFEAAATKTTETRPIRLLHLSDLHFDASTPVSARLQWLLDDLKFGSELGYRELDYLVVSGDFTDKACPEGFEKAYEFLSELAATFELSAERCVLVPGNHDVANLDGAYAIRRDSKGLPEGEWFQEGRLILARDPERYPLRFKPFSDNFYHKFLQRPYPFAPTEQGVSIPFWDSGIQFLTLNSCWKIDEFHRQRAGVHPEAIANVLAQAQKQVDDALKSGQLAADKPLLRIAVWHHAVTAPDYKMKDLDFLGNLQKNGVRIALHGDVHEMRRAVVEPWRPGGLHVIGAGSFGARAADRAESIPRLYNVLEIARDFSSMRVHTRRQRKPDGVWDGWCEWPDPDGGKGRVPYYDVALE